MLMGRHSASNSDPAGEDRPAAAPTAIIAHLATVTTADSYLPARRYSGRACCCPSLPAVVAILPPAGDRTGPTDLLLCGHHYRASRKKLAQLGAFFLDLQGYPLPADSWPHSA